MIASTGLSALALTLTAASTGPIIDIGENVRLGNSTSITEGFIESNDWVTLIDETHGVLTLSEPLVVDTLAFNGLSGLSDGSPASLPAGTRVASLLMHFDPIGHPQTPVSISAWFSSYGPVALIYSDDLLDASDEVLGRAGITYPTGQAGRGLETDAVQVTESLAPWSAPIATTSMNWTESGTGIDSMRIVIALDLPEPTTVMMMTAMAGALLSARRCLRS